MIDTWNHQIQPWREAHRSGEGHLYVFLGITNLETITHCEQELEVRSATHDVRGPNFSLHPSGKAGRWQTGLLFYLHLYSNQGMFSVPDVLKPSRLRPLFNSTFCISPDILEATQWKES